MIIEMDSQNVKIQKTCPFCKTKSEVVVPTEGYSRWVQGELIQRAMPTVPPTSREFLKTGICRNCQETLFDLDDDDEEEE